jgi:hypothetical protein
LADGNRLAEPVGSSTLPLLPNRNRAIVEPAKLRDYALNPDHPVGGSKARVFRAALGFTRNDWATLGVALVEGLQTEPVVGNRAGPNGTVYEVVIPVTGLNGRTAPVTTAWEIAGIGVPRLVTAYVRG